MKKSYLHDTESEEHLFILIFLIILTASLLQSTTCFCVFHVTSPSHLPV